MLLGIPLGSQRHFGYGGNTLCAGPFKSFAYDADFLLPVSPAELTEWSHDPEYATPAGYHAYSV